MQTAAWKYRLALVCFLLATAIRAQPLDISNPKSVRGPVALKPTDGKAVLQVIVGRDSARILRIPRPPSPGLEVTAEHPLPLLFDQWYCVVTNVDLILEPVDANTTLSVEVAEPAAACHVQMDRYQGEVRGAVAAAPLSVAREAQPPRPAPATDDGGAVPGSVPWLVLALVAVLAAGVLVVYLVRKWLLTKAPATNTAPPQPVPDPNAVRFQMLDKRLASLEWWIENTGSRKVDDERLQRALDGAGFAQQLHAVERNVTARMEQLQDASIRQVREIVAAQAKETTSLGERLTVLERRSNLLAKRADEHLTSALKVLSEVYFRENSRSADGPSPDERNLIAKRLDEELSAFFRQAVPARDGLMERRERIKRILQAGERLLKALRARNPEQAQIRFGPGLEEALQIDHEVDGLISAATTQKLRVSFQVSFSTSQASRESLADGISSGLKNQVLKLAQPCEYFDRRIDAVALSLAQNAADLLDLSVDELRRDGDLQRLFSDLVRDGGLEVIEPPTGSVYQAGEHTVVQAIPRAPSAGSHTVARTATRGFRKGSAVLRKAAVILYE